MFSTPTPSLHRFDAYRLDLLELEIASPNTTDGRAILLRLLNVLTGVIRRPI